MIPVWKVCPSFEGYDASENGSIRRTDKGKCSTHKRADGYVRLSVRSNAAGLWGNYKRKSTGVHVLVADAFYGACPAGLEVDHINGAKDDNRAENLRYVTHSENLRSAIRLLGTWAPRGKDHPFYGKRLSDETRRRQSEAKLGGNHFRAKELPVEEIKARLAAGENHADIATRYRVGRTTVGDIMRGTHWQVRAAYIPRDDYRPMNAIELAVV